MTLSFGEKGVLCLIFCSGGMAAHLNFMLKFNADLGGLEEEKESSKNTHSRDRIQACIYIPTPVTD